MKDYILRASAGNNSVRVFIATTQNLVNEAQKLHKTTPVATAALGRLLTAAAMMGMTLKNDSDITTLTIKGDGELGGVTAVTDNASRVKGYVHNPSVQHMKKAPGKLDVGRAVGEGTLSVVRDLGLKEPVSGQVALVSGEIAEDITYYFATSEQTPSSVALGVLVDTDFSVKCAGGYIIQLLPDAPEEIIQYLEQKLPMFPSVTSLLDANKTPEDILEMLLHGFNPVVYEKIFPEYYCNCSVERTRKALAGVGVDELRLILEEDKGANIHCHFCRKDYFFNEGDIKELIKKGLSL